VAAEVYATDDVSQRDYQDQPTFQLAHRILNSKVKYYPNVSVFDLGQNPNFSAFDVVIFGGVFYHLKDPLLALARLRSVMKTGGVIIVEGEVINGYAKSLARFYYHEIFKEDRSNWWVPTIRCLHEWVESSYFDLVQEFLLPQTDGMMSLRRKIKGAMIYPVTIITVAVIVTLILLVFVIPVFSELFGSFGKALPLPTQIVINISNFVVNYLHFMIAMVVMIVVAIRQTYKTERGRFFLDRFMLHVPVMGDLIRKASIARFSRTLGTLVASGVPILDSLTITAKTAGNKVVDSVAVYITGRHIEASLETQRIEFWSKRARSV
jgi:uncharacterized protein YggT (Ycf19 family)